MGRAPCCSKVGLHRGPWTPREDTLLSTYIEAHGEGHWKYLPKKAGLLRCGKSCRLRWMNYLRPNIKRGNITPDEDDLIMRLHSLLGNRWSLIAGRLSGRTDNEIKNYWNTHLSRKLQDKKKLSLPPQPPKKKKRNDNNKKKNTTIISRTRQTQVIMEEKHTIHTPKAIRITCNPKMTSSIFYTRSINFCSSHAGFDIISTEEAINNIVPWGEDAGVGYFAGDDDDDEHHYLANSSSDTGLLEEYLQLLETEEEENKQQQQ